MAQRPNIIVLILDALRAGNVSAYGYPSPTTPRLDEFAAQNILFRRAFSAATWTVPSHASLLTGLYVSQHGIESIEADRELNDSVVTLPAALGANGYRTAAFSQNMLFGPNNHLEQGFDEFHTIDELLQTRRLSKQILRMSDDPTSRFRMAARYMRKMIAPTRLLDGILNWVDESDEEQPFFLMANVLEPHFPWTLPPTELLRQGLLHPRYVTRRDLLTLKKQWQYNSGKQEVTEEHRQAWSELYDASIVRADREIHRFLNRLKKWKGWEDTIVVITSDHGELLGDHNGIVGHMLSLSDKLIHVPLVVRHPDYSSPTEVAGVVQTHDLYASLMDWTAAETGAIPAAQLQRPPFSAAISRPENSGGYAFAEEDYSDSYDVIGKLLKTNPEMDPHKYPRQQIAVRSATHKYVWCDDRPGEFYDCAADPGELQNLIDRPSSEQKGILEQLKQEMSAWKENLETFPPKEASDATQIDSVAMERLRSLGYVL